MCSAGTAARRSSTAASPTTSRSTSTTATRPYRRHGDGDDPRSCSSCFQRGASYLMKADPTVDIGWWQLTQRLRARDSKLRSASQVPQAFRLQHAGLLPARIHARPDGVDGAGGRLPGPVPGRSRRAPVMSLPRPLPTAPPSASGRSRHDVLLGLDRCGRVRASGRLTGIVRQMAAPRGTRPHHDADASRTGRWSPTTRHVVALTLTAPDGRPLPPWRAGAHWTSICRADWSGSTRCAATPKSPTRIGSRCGGFPTAAAARSRCTTPSRSGRR